MTKKQRNIVDPFGTIHTTTTYERSLMGNRGVLGGNRLIGPPEKYHAGQNWIYCRYRGLPTPSEPPRYSVLFFLDEATALAAGHRPCGHCSQPKYETFKILWQEANPGAADIDATIHQERFQPYQQKWPNKKVIHSGFSIDELPVGTIILCGNENIPCLVLEDSLRPWSITGYGTPVSKPACEKVSLLTPPSVVNVLRTGFSPQIYPAPYCDSDCLDAHYDLALLYEQKGRQDEAIREYQAVLNINPEHTSASLKLGMMTGEPEQWAEFIQKIRVAMLNGKEEPVKISEAAVKSLREQSFDDTVDEDAEQVFHIGLDLAEEGKTDEAVRKLQSAIKKMQGFTEAHFNLGIVFLEQKNFKAAETEFLTVTRQIPNHAEAYGQLGYVYEKIGLQKQAVVECQLALTFDPDNLTAHRTLGAVYYKQEHYDKAVHEFTRALFLDHNDPQTHYQLAISYQQLGNLHQFQQHLDKARHLGYIPAYKVSGENVPQTITSNPKVIKQATRHFDTGQARQKEGNLDEAIEEFHTALQLDNNQAEIHFELGKSYQKQGRWGLSITEFQAAVQLDPENMAAHFGLALAYQELGEWQFAFNEAKQVAALGFYETLNMLTKPEQLRILGFTALAMVGGLVILAGCLLAFYTPYFFTPATPSINLTPVSFSVAAIAPTATTVSPTNTPLPPTEPPMPSPTFTVIPTATPLLPLQSSEVTVNVAVLNMRAGPGTNYDIVGKYKEGDVLTVLGRNTNGDWLKVKEINGGRIEFGWMSTEFLSVEAEIEDLPIKQITPAASTFNSPITEPTSVP